MDIRRAFCSAADGVGVMDWVPLVIVTAVCAFVLGCLTGSDYAIWKAAKDKQQLQCLLDDGDWRDKKCWKVVP